MARACRVVLNTAFAGSCPKTTSHVAPEGQIDSLLSSAKTLSGLRRVGCTRSRSQSLRSTFVSHGIHLKEAEGPKGRSAFESRREVRRSRTSKLHAFPLSSRTAEPAQPPTNGAHESENGTNNGGSRTGFDSPPDMDEIAAKVAAIERQEAAMVRELNHFASLVKETSRAVTERANSTRIEMAKLRKTVQLQQQEELRRMEDVRRQGEEKIKEDYQRMEDLRRAEDERRASEAAKLASESTRLEALGVLVGMGADKGIGVKQGLESGLGDGESRVAGGGFAGLEDGVEVLGPDLVPEKYECVVAHPGALCCTKTFIRQDPTLRTAVIDMQTTVQCTGDALSSSAILSLNPDDFVALGVHSLAEAAADLSKTRSAQLTQAPPDLAEKHRGILETLATGKIVSARPMEPPSNFGHESFVVELLDKNTGKQVTALFKPKVEGDADGWHRAPVELIAYELNLMLGMDYVPPVVYRKSGIDVDYRHFDEGAFIYFVPKTKPLKKVPAASWGVSVARLLSDTRVVDVLLNNSDRHAGHFLYGEHWADGKMSPVLIDHAAGFRKGELFGERRLHLVLNMYVTWHGGEDFEKKVDQSGQELFRIPSQVLKEAVVHMEHENAFQTGSVRCVSAKTYLRLRFLEKSQIVDKFSNVLSDSEIDGLIKRKEMVLAYLDKLVAERGYHRTVIE